MTEADKIKAFADRLANLGENYKADVAQVIEEVKEDGTVDASGLRRLASFMRKDETKREEQDALDHQYRFLAGLTPTPAELPPDGEIAKARALFADGLKIRDVAEAMDISVGKAHQLKVKAAAFDVHVHLNVNAPKVCPPKTNNAPTGFQVAPDAWHAITAARDATEAEWATEAARKEAERLAAIERKRAERERIREENRRIDSDDLAFPIFLRSQPERGGEI